MPDARFYVNLILFTTLTESLTNKNVIDNIDNDNDNIEELDAVRPYVAVVPI